MNLTSFFAERKRRNVYKLAVEIRGHRVAAAAHARGARVGAEGIYRRVCGRLSDRADFRGGPSRLRREGIMRAEVRQTVETNAEVDGTARAIPRPRGRIARRA